VSEPIETTSIMTVVFAIVKCEMVGMLGIRKLIPEEINGCEDG
jgi:hypothetical protein